jgi:hypothetical protein
MPNAMQQRPFVGIPLGHRSSGFRRFTIDEYHKMTAAGTLTEDDHLEFFDGSLMEK